MPDGGLGPGRRGPGGQPPASNVLGGALLPCSVRAADRLLPRRLLQYRPEDLGLHVVCAEMTREFLAFSKARGNDLSTPRPEYGFAGLKPGDRWCLCAARWEEARSAGMAPKVLLEATHIAALEVCSLDDLKAHAVEVLSTARAAGRGGSRAGRINQPGWRSIRYNWAKPSSRTSRTPAGGWNSPNWSGTSAFTTRM